MTEHRSESTRRLRRRDARLASLALLLAASCGGGAGSGGTGGPSLTPPADSSASFGTVGDFHLTERSGRGVSRADLAGEPWLAGFVFTRCSTICPVVTRQMARVQSALEGSAARLVCFTVDPQHDTPEVLREYADEVVGADPERWLFLTGDQDAVYELIRKSFLLAVAMDPGQDPGLLVSHSAYLVAVDREGRIRGYYDGQTSSGADAATARIRFLESGRTDGAGLGATPFPKINASLNAAAAVLLACGLVAIRRNRRELHGRLMTAAFAVSALFLASYLYYHLVIRGQVRFEGEGFAKSAYLALLGTHVVGAIVNLPMVLRTLWLAHRERWPEHRRWAKRTFPLWMYVSVTGVLVYLVLYHWNPRVA